MAVTREILNSHPVGNLKKEIAKTNIRGYSKMKKSEIVDVMMKNKERFGHIKHHTKAPRAKPAPKPAPKKEKIPYKKVEKKEKKPLIPKIVVKGTDVVFINPHNPNDKVELDLYDESQAKEMKKVVENSSNKQLIDMSNVSKEKGSMMKFFQDKILKFLSDRGFGDDDSPSPKAPTPKAPTPKQPTPKQATPKDKTLEQFGKLPKELKQIILDPKKTGIKVGAPPNERAKALIDQRIKAFNPKSRAGSNQYRKQGNVFADELLSLVGKRLSRRGGDWQKSNLGTSLVQGLGNEEARTALDNFEAVTQKILKDVAKGKADEKDAKKAENEIIKKKLVKLLKNEIGSIYQKDSRYIEGANNIYKTVYDKTYEVLGVDDKSVKVKIGHGSRGAPDDLGKIKKIPLLTFYSQTLAGSNIGDEIRLMPTPK